MHLIRRAVRLVLLVCKGGILMEDIQTSVYNFLEAVGTSPNSWEDAVKSVVTKASETIEDIRIVEIIKLDAKVENQRIVLYRARVKLSFKLKGAD